MLILTLTNQMGFKTFFFYVLSVFPEIHCISCQIFLYLIFTETIFHCPEKNGTKTFDITCPDDTVINITDAIYGRNKWELCMYLTNDCTEKVDLNSECCGRRQCSVTVWRIYSLNCTYVTFFRLIYECVKSKYLYT